MTDLRKTSRRTSPLTRVGTWVTTSVRDRRDRSVWAGVGRVTGAPEPLSLKQSCMAEIGEETLQFGPWWFFLPPFRPRNREDVSVGEGGRGCADHNTFAWKLGVASGSRRTPEAPDRVEPRAPIPPCPTGSSESGMSPVRSFSVDVPSTYRILRRRLVSSLPLLGGAVPLPHPYGSGLGRGATGSSLSVFPSLKSGSAEASLSFLDAARIRRCRPTLYVPFRPWHPWLDPPPARRVSLPRGAGFATEDWFGSLRARSQAPPTTVLFLSPVRSPFEGPVRAPKGSESPAPSARTVTGPQPLPPRSDTCGGRGTAGPAPAVPRRRVASLSSSASDSLPCDSARIFIAW